MTTIAEYLDTFGQSIAAADPTAHEKQLLELAFYVGFDSGLLESEKIRRSFLCELTKQSEVEALRAEALEYGRSVLELSDHRAQHFLKTCREPKT